MKASTVEPRTALDPLIDEAAARYRAAANLAVVGRVDDARAAFDQLASRPMSAELQRRAGNDRAVLEALCGNIDRGIQSLETLLSDGPDALVLDNLNLLRGDYKSDLHAPPSPAVPMQIEDRRTRVAVLSLLFNWPSTGGGNVHTAELAFFLNQSGYDVRHFFARFAPWGIGRIETRPPLAGDALEFDETTWNLHSIQHAFAETVDQFCPDFVIITDSWNFKPHLARAVSKYPFLLRLQALECLCPLNNVRLLPGARQCSTHQLADVAACRNCLARHADWSGPLHMAERRLSGVGTDAYDQTLRWSFRAAHSVLAVNTLTAAMVGPYCRRVDVVPSGFDPVRFPWTDAQPVARSPGEPRQIFLAALVQEGIKGFAVVQEACERMWSHRQDFELVATGDPPRRVNDFIRFVGWKSQGELPACLRDSDIVVLPTIAQEALGRTAVEAMAVGRPVVASRLGGLPETLSDGAGLLCEPNDPADLAAKLERLLDDRQLALQLGRAGRRRFEDVYAWPAIIDRHYRRLLNPAMAVR